MNIYPTCGPGDMPKMQDKETKRLIRKQIKQTLSKLLEKSLFEDKNRNEECNKGLQNSPEQSVAESMVFYGKLTNSITKKFDLIFSANISHSNGTKLVYYTVSNKDLFKSFPAAGTYLGPYTSCKPVFIEVLAQVEDFYICKLATQLRYLELLSMKGE